MKTARAAAGLCLCVFSCSQCQSPPVPPEVEKAKSQENDLWRAGAPLYAPGDYAVYPHLRRLAPELGVVVAYGHILTETILGMPKQGCINVHASLLPRYRGPAPIHWAIINGEKETGVTTMMMDKGLDTGDILLEVREPIFVDDTAGSLHDRLASLGAQLLCQTLDRFADNTIRRFPQNHSQATYAPLLKKTDGLIDWEKPAILIEPFIRGMSPWPGAFTYWGNRRLKIFKAAEVQTEESAPPGTILKSAPNELAVATSRGALSILEIQEASGSRLPVSEFLRGCRIATGDILG